MNHRPTLKDVAAAAKVSVSTASRALAGNPAISPATSRIVEKAAKKLGYRPNSQARSLRLRQPTTIGIVVPSLLNHYFAAMATTIQAHVAEAGFTAVIATSNESPEEQNRALDSLIDQQVAGIICVPHEDCASRLTELVDAAVPLVFIDRSVTGQLAQVPSVTSDPSAGIAEAVQLLSRFDDGTIGYLAGPQTTSTGRERLAIFESATQAQSITDYLTFLGGYDQQRGFKGANELLDRGATKLLAGDSMMTIGVLEACHKKGLVIGEDVAVVGFDTQPLFELQPCPITVIDQGVHEMAGASARTLLQLIAGHPPDNPQLRLPTTLLARPSTSPKRGGSQ